MTLLPRYGRILVVLLALAAGAWGLATRRSSATDPFTTTTPVERNGPRHAAINERARLGNVDLLFLGDSITQGWEADGKEVWKKRYESRKAMNAGISGDRTQHVLCRWTTAMSMICPRNWSC